LGAWLRGLAAYSTRAGECARVIGLAGDAAGELAVRWMCTIGTVADIPAAACEAVAANAATVSRGTTTAAADRTIGDAILPPLACAALSIVAAAIADVVLGAEAAMEPEDAGTPGTQDRGDIVGMCDKPTGSCPAEA